MDIVDYIFFQCLILIYFLEEIWIVNCDKI